jgi:hypothetical protein
VSARSLDLVVQMSLSESTILLAGSGQAAELAVLVNGVSDPVDAGITTDGLVAGVDENDLVIFVRRVLTKNQHEIPVFQRTFVPRRTHTRPLFSLPPFLCLFFIHPFSMLHCSYLVDPVRADNAQVSTSAANTLLGNGPQRALELQCGDTLGLGFTIDLTLGNRPLAATTTNADTVDDVSLLGL